jgi:hypothetical protein
VTSSLLPSTTVAGFVPVSSVNTMSVFRVIYAGGPCSIRYPTKAIISIEHLIDPERFIGMVPHLWLYIKKVSSKSNDHNTRNNRASSFSISNFWHKLSETCSAPNLLTVLPNSQKQSGPPYLVATHEVSCPFPSTRMILLAET